MNASSPPPPALKLVPAGPRLEPQPIGNVRPANVYLGRLRRIPLLGKIS